MILRNWSGNVAYSTEVLHRPAGVDQLQQLVADAPRIRALGTGHTFNTITDTDGALVTLAGLDPIVHIDPAARTVSAAAGMRFGELSSQLDAAGWALPNLGSLPHISLAGACATGTHGAGNANRCLAAAAVGIDFVQADGTLVSLDASDPAFPGSVLALGALGIATSLTLAIEPAFQVRQDVWLDTPFATVLDRIDEIMAAGYSVSLFTDFTRPDIIDKIWIKTRTGAALADGREWGAQPATAAQHPIAGQDPSAATEQLGVPGPWHARLPHFRLEFTPSAGEEQQSEYLLPRPHAAAALAALRGLDLRAALQVCELRTVAADDLWLSPCGGRDTFALHFTWVDDDALVDAAVRAVEAALAPFDPRPHWGKVFTVDPRPHYPKLTEFRSLVDRHDPNHKFGNAFLERHVY
ncbi:MAG TPA: FAD-binding protein [Jatrophihabitans sp.]|nr:FAD-binding protein [Jatrophihabitans sp.]